MRNKIKVLFIFSALLIIISSTYTNISYAEDELPGMTHSEKLTNTDL